MNTRFLFYFALFYFITHLHHGFSKNSVEKIIGGVETNITCAPYMLSLRINGRYACCAAIINECLVITAAHCVNAASDPMKEITLCSGSSISQQLDNNCIIHRPTKIFFHYKYDVTTNDYDIAMMKITPEFVWDDSTKALNIPQGDPNKIYKESGIVCGWGYTRGVNNQINTVISKNLNCVKIQLIGKYTCMGMYKYEFVLTPRMVCYGYQNGAKDTCKGDSGAPLVNNDNTLIGVTSWGLDCGKINSPGIYTDTILLHNWIKNIIKMEIYTKRLSLHEKNMLAMMHMIIRGYSYYKNIRNFSIWYN